MRLFALIGLIDRFIGLIGEIDALAEAIVHHKKILFSGDEM